MAKTPAPTTVKGGIMFIPLPPGEFTEAVALSTFAGAVGLNLKIYARARETCPIGHGGGYFMEDRPPGTLRASMVHEEALGGPFGWIVRVGTYDPVGWYVHEGTVEHEISPRAAKALRFVGWGGVLVFATHVTHPGNKPNPWLREAQIEIVRASGLI
jgi:hypothetical protein